MNQMSTTGPAKIGPILTYYSFRVQMTNEVSKQVFNLIRLYNFNNFENIQANMKPPKAKLRFINKQEKKNKLCYLI